MSRATRLLAWALVAAFIQTLSLAADPASTTGRRQTEPYLVGVGKADITGPISDVQMMGYAHRLERGQRGQTIRTFQKPGDTARALGQGSEHDRTVRDRFIARHAKRATQLTARGEVEPAPAHEVVSLRSAPYSSRAAFARPKTPSMVS